MNWQTTSWNITPALAPAYFCHWGYYGATCWDLTPILFLSLRETCHILLQWYFPYEEYLFRSYSNLIFVTILPWSKYFLLECYSNLKMSCLTSYIRKNRISQGPAEVTSAERWETESSGLIRIEEEYSHSHSLPSASVSSFRGEASRKMGCDSSHLSGKNVMDSRY